ncbi:MAG: hypothetical protein IPM66_12760 [Acidobacteriota bacterium]|nr:MAG: hypothetical protein IPM66_12760 [Acidobacteriota bacterium]
MRIFAALLLAGAIIAGLMPATQKRGAVEAIRAEALRPNFRNGERPLPLAGHWNLGEAENGFDPEYQMGMIDEGHHLLPWFLMPNIHAHPEDPRWLKYYEAAVRKAARLKLPISLIGTQWEAELTTSDEYFNLPQEQNPNVVLGDGRVKREVSPFGPVEPWRDVGVRWGSTRMLKLLQQWYPDPPRVILISNNEHARLHWMQAEEDRRYVRMYGRRRDAEFKRRVVGDGWIERYRALQKGILDGLSARAWKSNSIFVAYDAFGPAHFARWPGWLEHSLYSSGRSSPWPLAWDGTSPSFYVFNWSANTDHTVFSPQIETMNWIFMQKEALKLNPEFWFEMSTWDGHEPGDSDKRAAYARSGQRFTPARYGGMVQFGMWLLRPRVVREFRGYRDTLSEAEPYFLSIVEAVDRVHSQPILTEFWRRGELVANRAHAHPYQTIVPPEYQKVDRWFLLDTSIDPKRPWELGTVLPVYSLALVKGSRPNRQWLVYAHAPVSDRKGVQVAIPDYRNVRIDVPVAGTFYLVDEKSQRVQIIK